MKGERSNGTGDWRASTARPAIKAPVQAVSAALEDDWRPSNPRPGIKAPVQAVSQAAGGRPMARAAASEPAERSVLSFKEADYSDDLAEAEDAERPALQASLALTNEEIFRIVREVAAADSGDAGYSAVVTDADYPASQRQFGLAFGLTLFTQESGRLGSVLRLMKQRDPAAFAEIFGADADALLAVTNTPSAAERLASAGGQPLWSPNWVERFRRAGEVPACQYAQNEEAIEGQFRPMLRVALLMGLASDRALAMAYDRVVTQGLGGGLRWVVETAGPLRTGAQRTHALKMLGFGDLAQFQSAVGLTPSGRFTHETHAALAGELRKRGEATLPLPDQMAYQLYASATGAAKLRLRRLLDSTAFTDVVFA